MTAGAAKTGGHEHEHDHEARGTYIDSLPKAKDFKDLKGKVQIERTDGSAYWLKPLRPRLNLYMPIMKTGLPSSAQGHRKSSGFTCKSVLQIQSGTGRTKGYGRSFT